MSFSQNLLIAGTGPADEDDLLAPGQALARLLSEHVQRAGWSTGEVDLWRGAGWFFICKHGEAELELTLGRVEPGEWMLQLAPARSPGALGRLFGGRVSADRHAVQRLAQAVHGAFAEMGGFSRTRWCWDGFPGDGETTSEPQPYSA